MGASRSRLVAGALAGGRDDEFVVTNGGEVPITGIDVHDPVIGPVTCPVTTLAAHETTTCTATYTVTAGDVTLGHIANTAQATGEANGNPVSASPSTEVVDVVEPPGLDAVDGLVTNTAVASGHGNDQTISSPPSQATVLIGAPRLTVRKRVTTPGPHLSGAAVQYEYVVTNTGPLTLHDVAVVDDRVVSVTCDTVNLAPRQSTVCHATYRVTALDASLGRVTNIAQAAGTDSHGDTFVSDPVTATFPVVGMIPVTG